MKKIISLLILSLILLSCNKKIDNMSENVVGRDLSDIQAYIENRLGMIVPGTNVIHRIISRDDGYIVGVQNRDNIEILWLNKIGEIVKSYIPQNDGYNISDFNIFKTEIKTIGYKIVDSSLHFRLFNYDLTRKETTFVELNAISFNYSSIWLKDFVIDSKGNISVLINNKLFIWDKNGMQIKSLNGYIYSIDITEDDSLIIALGDVQQSTNIIKYDYINGKKIWVKKVDRLIHQLQCRGGEVYLEDDEVISIYNSNGSFKKYFFDIRDTDFYTSDNYIIDFDINKNEEVSILSSSDCIEIYNYTINPVTPPKKEKVTLTISYSHDIHKYLQLAIARYKKHRPDIEVKILKLFSIAEFERGDIKEYIKVLNTQLLSGKSPDIIVTNESRRFPKIRVESKRYINNNILVDLLPYIDGENGLNREDYNFNVLNALRTEDKLFVMPTGFIPKVVVINKEWADRVGAEVPNGNWTWNEFITLVEKFRLDSDGDNKADKFALPYTKPSVFLANYLLPEYLPKLIDDTNSVCDFTDNLFLDLLKIADRFDYANNRGNSTKSKRYIYPFHFGHGITIDSSVGDSFSSPTFARERLATDDIVYAPFPGDTDAKGHIYESSIFNYSISKLSRQKDEAWNFLKFLISEEMLRKDKYQYGYLNKRALDYHINNYKIDLESGKLFEDYSDMSIKEGDLEVQLEIMNSSTRYRHNNGKVQDIVMEISEKYFNKEISAEEASRRIQNKVSIIMAE